MLGRLGSVAGRRLKTVCLSIILLALCGVSSVYAAEAALRVAFVYNFLKFIEWPHAAGQTLLLCALGAEGNSRQALAQLAKKSPSQRAIAVIYLDDAAQVAQQLAACNMLYRPVSGERLALPDALPRGVLLVADEASDDPRVAIALLRTPDNRMEFVINEAAVATAGVKVSSQLRKLAKKAKSGGQ